MIFVLVLVTLVGASLAWRSANRDKRPLQSSYARKRRELARDHDVTQPHPVISDHDLVVTDPDNIFKRTKEGNAQHDHDSESS